MQLVYPTSETFLSSSSPDPVQVKMTTRSPQTQPLSQVTRSGPSADSVIAIYHPPKHHHKTLKSLHDVDYNYSGKFLETCENIF